MRSALERSTSARGGAVSNSAPSIDDTGLLSAARSQCIGRFVGQLTPATRYEEIRLERDRESRDVSRGIQLAQAGDMPGARDAFESAVELAPNNPAAVYDLGITLLCLGEYERSIQTLRDAHRLSPRQHIAEAVVRAQKWRDEAAPTDASGN